MHQITKLCECEFCKIQNKEQYHLRRVKCYNSHKFRTVWVDRYGVKRCTQTGAKVSERNIDTEPRNSYYIWAKKEAKLKYAKFKTGQKLVCEHCYSRELKRGNCEPTTRRGNATKQHQIKLQKQALAKANDAQIPLFD